jgi:hypothetical protein
LPVVRRRPLRARSVFLVLFGLFAWPVSLGTLAGGEGLFLLLGGFVILEFSARWMPGNSLVKRGRLITPAAAFAQEDALHEH